MSLRVQAEADLRAILGDTDGGFGWPVTVIAPDGRSLATNGLTADIHQTIDPQTGVVVSGRRVSVTVSVKALADAGLGLPVAVSSRGVDPWRVRYAEVDGKSRTFKVVEAIPDRSLGIVVCHLEALK